jgi:RNA polymerase sigma-70 factor (ECF subfamily)
MTNVSNGEATCARSREGSTSTERRVLQTLYLEYEERVRSFCQRMLRDPTAAEDVTHETFLSVRPYLAVTDESQRLSLLYRIAKNHCLNVIRQSRVRARHLAMGRVLEPEQSTETTALRCSAEQELRLLSKQTQRVLILTYAAGMTQAEVARHLGISRRTVVYRLNEVRSVE